MVDPPRRGVESEECVAHFLEQQNGIMEGLKERSTLLEEVFNSMDNITCAPIEGAMYAFPRVHFSEKFLSFARADGRQPDFIYCL